MAARRRSRDAEPDAPANSPRDVGWTTTGARAGETRREPTGRNVHTPVVVPDPGIRFGSFRVLQRTDGPFVIIDERLPPGSQVVETIPFARKSRESAEDARRRVLKDAEQRCNALAYPKHDGEPTQ